jgi:diguanylate cyclase (GGDEF)-like protein/PAS domain S-box-containing protein
MNRSPSESTKPRDPIPPPDDHLDAPISWEPSKDFFKYAIASQLVGSVGIFVALRILAPDQLLRTSGSVVAFLVAMTGWYLLSRGKIQATGRVLAYGIWIIATVVAIFTGGVRAPIVIIYPMLILMFGWLISSRAALAVTCLSVAVTVGFLLADTHGFLPAPLPSPTALHGIVEVILAVLSFILVGRLVRAYQDRLLELRATGNDLALRTKDVEASKTELTRAQAVASVGSWVYEIVPDAMRLSAETCRIFGVPEGVNSNHDIYLSRVHPEDRSNVERAWQIALKGGAPFDNEHRILVGKKIRWVRQKAELELGPDSTPLRAVGIAQDITERKLVEVALRESENRMSAIFQASPIAIVISRVSDGKILDGNDAAMRLYGYEREEAIGRTVAELETYTNPAQRKELVHRFQQGSVERFPLDFRHRNGERGALEVSGRVVELNDELCLVTLLVDVTERNRVEEELKKTIAFSESLSEAMPLPVFHKDASGRYTGCNGAFARFIGKDRSEILGKTVFEVSPQNFAKGYKDKDLELLTDPIGTQTYEGSVAQGDGIVRDVIFHKARLMDSVGNPSGIVGVITDITEHKKTQEKIQNLAFFDQLTGLPNKTLLLDRLRQVLTGSSRSRIFGALLFIDLDNFKTINDTLGHQKGDLLLQQVAKQLAIEIRDGDTVARFGGDEFVILLVGLSSDEGEAAGIARLIATKMLKSLDQAYELDGVTQRSTASIGVTLFRGDNSNIDDLLKQADLAMYQSKEGGRNLVRFFDPSLESAVKERVALEENLQRAVEEKQFLLHYQAQVVGKGRVTGAEVLVRWQHPEQGLVSPALFIPLAEETGLILPLGKWVLETACAQLAKWAIQPTMTELTIAVNVSVRQFRQPDFVDQVLTALKHTGANPHRLKLELTESLLVENVEDVIEKMFALKSKGVGFSLDDFGTGYSSLSYLKRLPLDQLKIDQSFVRDVLNDPDDAAIARTIVALGQSLGMGVIAEGVETEEQREVLASLGCHAYQGYLFSRPVPVAAFEEYVAKVEV